MEAETVSQVDAARRAEAAYFNGTIDVVALPRAWVHDHGWPESYGEALAWAASPEGRAVGVRRFRETRAGLMQSRWQVPRPPEQGYVREGEHGQAFIFLQGWDGPA